MRRLQAILLALAALSLSTSAGATPVTLSSVSSDETPASALDATFDFSVVGSTLTLVATNDTTASDEFNINQVYFNATSAVIGLTDGVGAPSVSLIGPSESVTFVFTISGVGPFSDADFIQGNVNGLTAAAKFVNGPGDDSAYGAVPEPSTALLLASGLILLGARRRSRR